MLNCGKVKIWKCGNVEFENLEVCRSLDIAIINSIVTVISFQPKIKEYPIIEHPTYKKGCLSI